MKRPMTLMDKVHAWTFAAKRGPMKLEPAVLDVQRTLRAKLRAAERFSTRRARGRSDGSTPAGRTG